MVTVSESGRSRASGGKGAHYLRFWTFYLVRVRALHPSWAGARNPVRGSWVGQRSGIPGTYISVCFGRDGTLRHELYIDTGNAADNDALFEDFLSRREAMEEAYGHSLDFQPLPDRRGCRIADHGIGDVRNEEQWNQYVRWFLDAGSRLRRALAAGA